MILVTTSHKPSARTRSFVKDLVSVIPFSRRTNRGHKTLAELALETKRSGFSYLVLVREKRGNPGAIDFYEVLGNRLHPETRLVARVVLGGITLSRENPLASRAYGAKSVNIDFSQCISDDCFFLADLLLKVLGSVVSDNYDLKLVLEEEKYIVLKCLNVHGALVGPVLKIARVFRGEELAKGQSNLQSRSAL